VLIDNYYGQRGQLERAAELLRPELLKDSPSAAAYMEASLLTYKGGSVGDDDAFKNAAVLSERLVDRALKLEPDNVRAISMKTLLLLQAKRHDEFRQLVQRGLSLDPNDYWLNLQLADYYLQVKKQDKTALQIYDSFYLRGPGTHYEQKRAFTYATFKLADYWHNTASADKLREYAARSERALHPDDAWQLGEFSRLFTEATLFDDGIAYARKALAIMNYGVGRLNLTVALYGKATQLAASNADFAPVLLDARGMGIDPDEVRDWFANSTPRVRALLPTLDRLLN